MSFKLWFEGEIEQQSGDRTPASAEVIRTGLQPQVDSQEIKTRQKEENDKMMAIDSHFQRIRTVIENMGTDGSDKLEKIKQFCVEMLGEWDELKQGNDQNPYKMGQPSPGFDSPKGQADWMKNNQPLPEQPRAANTNMNTF